MQISNAGDMADTTTSVKTSTETQTSTSVAPPKFNFDRSPRLAAKATPLPHPGNNRTSNFYRNAKWSPDGSAVLGHLEDRSLELLTLPPEILTTSEPLELKPIRKFKSPSALLSYAWFPRATVVDPPSWTFVRAIRDHPIQLINAGTGKVQASYPIVDHRELYVAPHSMCFSPDGSMLYSGHENAIEIHDMSRPGMEGIRVATTPSRRSREGQKGIISSISLSTSPWHSQLLCAGTFLRTIGLYQVEADGNISPLQIVDLPSDCASGGVSQVQFHPTLPLLTVASRLSKDILVYDVRNMSEPYCKIKRKANTNQRLEISTEVWGRGIISGDQEGILRYWEIDQEEFTLNTKFEGSLSSADFPIGHASLHPYFSLLLTTQGTRVFEQDYDNIDYDNNNATDSHDDVDSRQGSLSVWHVN